MKILGFFFILVYFFPSYAKVKEAHQVLEEMSNTYSQVNYMKSDFVKNEKSQLLGTSEKSKGKLEYSRKKVRLEFNGSKKGLLIKGEKKFWQVGEDGAVLVGEVSKSMPNIFEALFSEPKIWKSLDVKYIDVPKDLAYIKVDTKGKIPHVQQMKLKIDLAKRTLEELTYTDDINNEVKIKFKRIRFFDSARPERFVYKIKASDKVTNL